MGIYTSLNPATGKVIATFEEISDEDLRDVVSTSHEAYRSWRSTDITERVPLLRRAAELHRENRDDLALIITEEMGKPIQQSRGEIELVARIFDYYADNAEKFMADEKLDIEGSGTAIVRTEPIGVLVGVMPWNFPFYQVARFVAPNLALGNTIIIKHARNCPRAAQAIEDILTDASFPKGVYTNAFISSAQVADAIADPRIQGVSLTGSERAGAAVAEVAGRHLKKCVLELGGSDPVIVLADADIELAAKGAVANRLSNAGQACTASKRFLVADQIYDQFIVAFSEEMGRWKPGDPLLEDTLIGPLSSEDASEEISSLVNDALSKGANEVVIGGKGDGAFYAPGLLENVTEDMLLYKEELFGPVGVAYRFHTIDEAIEIANDSPYGLAASVYSTDFEAAEEVAARLEVGMVWINSTSKSAPDLPFGGVKLSGFGRELSRFGFDEFSNKKLVRNPGA